jgi:hypothetical protein
MAVGDPGLSTSNGTPIMQLQLNAGQNEQWTWEPAGSAPTVTYYVTNHFSGKALDNSLSTSNGTGIDQWQLGGGANQRWTFVPIADGTYLIVNASSGLVLDDPAYSNSDGAVIDQFQPNNGGNQEWKIAQQSDGYYTIQNAYSLKVLDDQQGSTSNGTPIIQYTWMFQDNQEWALLAAGNGPAVTYYVQNQSDHEVLDSAGGVESDPLTQNGYNGGIYQQWTFVPLADGYDLIVNVANGLVLDDPGGSASNYTTIDQWQVNGGLNQQWYIAPQANGSYAIENAASYLELASVSYQKDVFQFQWENPAELWTLTPV